MELKKKNMISANDAAKILGVTIGRVRQLIDEGKLKAEKLTPRAWAIEKKTVIAYSRSYRKRGPKPSKRAA